MKDFIAKIFRLALDPVAPDGEWQSAAVAAVRKLRREGIRELAELAPPAPAPRPSFTYRTSDYGTGPRMSFGKYKGERIADIARDEPAYLLWVLENCARLSPHVRAAIRRALEEAGVDY